MRLSASILPFTAALVSLASSANASCWHSGDATFPCPDLLAIRGGASTLVAAAMTVATAATGAEECPMDLSDVSLSLRYTCEMNRRLNAAVQKSASIHDSVPEIPVSRSPNHHNPAVSMQRGGQMVHVHLSQQPEFPIRMACDNADDVVTVFHSKEPSETRTGVKRWGPDLLMYLQHLTTALNIQKDPLVLQLAILYLDRACSVETPRSHGQEKCPYLVPRTVHRLLLTSLLIATKAVHPSNTDVESQLSSLGIPPQQLSQMQEWMKQSLGDMGVYVSQSQLGEFNETWERTFRKPKFKIRRRKQLIRPMNQENGKCFTDRPTSSDDIFVRDQHLREAALQCWA